MMQTPDALIGKLLQILWRRRWLITLPLLVLLPLSIVAAIYLPRMYVVRTLILVQQALPENPLIRPPTPVPFDRLTDRIAGLRAMLTSETVLLRAADAINAREEKVEDRRTLADGLAKSLTMESLGNNIVQVRLFGDKREGLAENLRLVLDHFIETGRASGVLKSGDEIKIVDPPDVPLHPLRSPLVTVAAGLVTALLLAFGLTYFAEQTDTRLRTATEFASATGLPVLAVLPHDDPFAEQVKKQRGLVFTLARLTLKTSFVVLVLAAFWLAMQPIEQRQAMTDQIRRGDWSGFIQSATDQLKAPSRF